jgi:WD40 repeat protein
MMVEDKSPSNHEGQSWAARYIPLLGWAPRYERSWLRPDLIAGLTVAALVVPKSLGYADIANVPIQHGLYAAAAGAILYAIFGTSRQISTGPSSALAAVAGNIRSVNFSPDGLRLATAHEDGSVRIWDISKAETGKANNDRLVHTLIGHSNTVFDAAFSPDGKHLATCSFDGTIRIWDVETGSELLILAEDSPGPDLDFSPDGKFLVLAGGDGTVRVFVLPIENLIELANSRLTRPLTTAECQKYLHLDTCPDANKTAQQ